MYKDVGTETGSALKAKESPVSASRFGDSSQSPHRLEKIANTSYMYSIC